MAVLEEPFQSSPDQERRCKTAQKSQRRFVVYFIAEDRAIRVRFNVMPVAPVTEGTSNLYVFEHPGRIISCMFGNPSCGKRSQNPGLDNGSRAGLRDSCLSNNPR